MGAVAWAMRRRSVSHPRSSNRTCRFPASGSPTGFTVRHTAFSIDHFVGESTSAASRYLVPSCEEVAHTLIDVVVDTSEYRPMRPIGEVARPAKQKRVQRIAHVRPGIVVAGRQQITDLCLEPLHALLGRACAQIPLAVRFVPVRSERVAEEVEALLSGIL